MRVDALDKPGGDLLQVIKYIEAGKIAKEDGQPRFKGTIITDLHADLSSFDLIHLTNIDRPVDTYHSFICAKTTGRPILLSPIHHSYTEIGRFERSGRSGIAGQISGLLGFTALEYLRSSARSRRYSQLISPTLNVMRVGMRESQRAILTGAELILVLTEKEKADIILDFGEISDKNFVFLRNGFEVRSHESNNVTGRDIDVCMVGRIEARKNQIKVLKVLKRLGISGIFVGAENPHHRSYCTQFKSMVLNSGSRYMGSISHEDTLKLMRRSRVHVSASWYEVLSMVDLEAYSAGCGIVASQCGGTQEILGDRAEYVYPESEESIENGIVSMLKRVSGVTPSCISERRDEPLSETWDQIGSTLAQLYRECVG